MDFCFRTSQHNTTYTEILKERSNDKTPSLNEIDQLGLISKHGLYHISKLQNRSKILLRFFSLFSRSLKIKYEQSKAKFEAEDKLKEVLLDKKSNFDAVVHSFNKYKNHISEIKNLNKNGNTDKHLQEVIDFLHEIKKLKNIILLNKWILLSINVVTKQ